MFADVYDGNRDINGNDITQKKLNKPPHPLPSPLLQRMYCVGFVAC